MRGMERGEDREQSERGGKGGEDNAAERRKDNGVEEGRERARLRVERGE